MAESKFEAVLGQLSAALKASGLPFNGMSPRPARRGEPAHFIEGGQGFFVELNIPEGATRRQREQLAAIVSGFSFTARRPKARGDILAIVRSLPDEVRVRLANAVMDELIADFIFRHPDYARKLGIEFDGDEPALQATGKHK